MKQRMATAPAGSPLGSPGDEVSTAHAVREMFASVAPRYDFLNHFLSLGRDIAWRRAAANSLRTILGDPGSVAVDLCCGTGDLAVTLARISKGRIIGTDFCHPMLQLARCKSACYFPRLTFVEADSLALPFADDSLDALSIAFGFRNLANYRKGLEEMLRVLRPGGVVSILEFSKVHCRIFGPIFRFYFRAILPRLGTWLSGVAGPYQYLHESVSCFLDQEALALAMREAGFTSVTYRNFTGGIAALHTGVKQSVHGAAPH